MKQINIMVKPKLGLKRCYVSVISCIDLLLLKIFLHWFDSPKPF
jgi:hypothetical protein